MVGQIDLEAVRAVFDRDFEGNGGHEGRFHVKGADGLFDHFTGSFCGPIALDIEKDIRDAAQFTDDQVIVLEGGVDGLDQDRGGPLVPAVRVRMEPVVQGAHFFLSQLAVFENSMA